MRLINTRTLELEEFVDSSLAPPYAILSHTWDDGEVSFHDVANLEFAAKKIGFAKIDLTCRQARNDDIGYAWVDTCCIDKTSSAELSEAINSMFRWYANAKVCYTYLSDLSPESELKVLRHCRWFTRGWTLQELIAPSRVEFYDRTWTFRGTKLQLSREIHEFTGISLEVLASNQESHERSLTSCLSSLPVATRMSWASGRTTTRREDRAYSLLGLFDVNMPVLYGEGDKAFLRLQEEIIKETNDLSILAWAKGVEEKSQRYHGVLASSPEDFRGVRAEDIEPLAEARFNPDFALTNKGLRLDTSLILEGDESYAFMPLASTLQDELGIFVEKHGTGLFVRTQAHRLASRRCASRREPGAAAAAAAAADEWRGAIFLCKHLTPERSAVLEADHRDAIKLGMSFFSPSWQVLSVQPEDVFDRKRSLFLTQGQPFFGSICVRPARNKVPSRRSVSATLGIVVMFELGKDYVHLRVDAAPSVVDLEDLRKDSWPVASNRVYCPGFDHTGREFAGVRVDCAEEIIDGQPVYVADIQTISDPDSDVTN